MEEQGTVITGNKGRSGLGRRMAPLLIAVVLVTAVAFGGVAGGAAMRYWIDHQPKDVAASTLRSATAQTKVALPIQGGSAASVYAGAGGAVVTVEVSAQQTRGMFSQPAQGEGSGFIVDEQGHIVTNYHVVQGAQNVSVILADETRVSAKVVGTDPGSDLALLKADVPQDKLIVAKLGDSDKLSVGDPVVAIGAPFSLPQTVTAGIVSALKRTFGDANGRPMRNLIQTDAPINPGNSGGPLFNLQGEVIGITTSIESPVRASVGIGFAIPINTAKALLPDLAGGGKIDHPYIGISGQAINETLAGQLQLPVTKGVLVMQTVADGPAAKAGIQGGDIQRSTGMPTGGDIITAVDSKEVRTVEDIAGYLDTKHVGDTVTVDLLRNGKTMQVKVQLEAWPQSQQS